MSDSPEEQEAGLSPAPLRTTKRLFDFVVGLALSLISFPLVALLALGSAIRFRASPFFVQQRIGRDGAAVRCIKIRSLDPQVPAYLDKEALQELTPDWRIAELIRRLHLDELPQFWQVVLGTMSLVGPRPMIASIVDRMQTDVARQRHSVRPGVTGAWQISVDGSNLIEDTCDYDLAYIRHASPTVDLKILLWTALQAIGFPKLTKQRVFDVMGVEPGEPHVAMLQLDGSPRSEAANPAQAGLQRSGAFERAS